MKTKTLITSLSIFALALTACGSDDEPSNTENTQEQRTEDTGTVDQASQPEGDDHNPMDGAGIMAAGEFEVYPEFGGHAVFDLPTSPDHEKVAPFEEYREIHNLDPITYIVIDVDNRDGTEILKFPAISAFDENGMSYQFEDIEYSGIIEEWGPERSWDMDNEQFWAPDGTSISFDEYQAIEDEYEALTESLNSSVEAAEHNTITLAYPGDDLPDEFTRVSTVTYGLGYEQDAYPAE